MLMLGIEGGEGTNIQCKQLHRLYMIYHLKRREEIS
jgi:hypothetical protein